MRVHQHQIVTLLFHWILRIWWPILSCESWTNWDCLDIFRDSWRKHWNYQIWFLLDRLPQLKTIIQFMLRFMDNHTKLIHLSLAWNNHSWRRRGAPQLHDTSLTLQNKDVSSDAYHDHGLHTHSFGTEAMRRPVWAKECCSKKSRILLRYSNHWNDYQA
jgi:hypothetical protein